MPNNWIGIRTSGVIAILGSVASLLIGGLMLFAAFFAAPPANASASPIPFKPMMIAMAVVFAAFGGWGMATAIAIFMHRRWARVSMLVYAVLLTFMSAGGGLAILFVQLPVARGGNPALPPMMRWGMAAVYGVLTGIGVWWLVLFNRASAKEYFGKQATMSDSGRPLSVAVIGWYLLISAAFVAPMAIFRLPAMLFGMVVTGWASVAVYAAFAVGQVCIGAGLLNLWENARLGAIAYFCFGAANTIVSMLGPGYQGMVRQLALSMPRFFPAGGLAAPSGPVWIFALMAAGIAAVPIYFLVRRRPAFRQFPGAAA